MSSRAILARSLLVAVLTAARTASAAPTSTAPSKGTASAAVRVRSAAAATSRGAVGWTLNLWKRTDHCDACRIICSVQSLEASVALDARRTETNTRADHVISRTRRDGPGRASEGEARTCSISELLLIPQALGSAMSLLNTWHASPTPRPSTAEPETSTPSLSRIKTGKRFLLRD